MSLQEREKVGMIGIGHMGGPMTNRLLDAGFEVVIFDASEAAMAPLVSRGATKADSPKAVGDVASVVLLSLPMPDIVLSVALGECGLVHGRTVRTVVDLSTTGPHAAATLAKGLAEKSIGAIDCPVSGGVAGAAKGALALMASGEKSRCDELSPLLGVLGRMHYVGNTPGMGQAMKVLNNLISVTSLAITSEAMVMGVKAGLDPDVMIEVINAGSGRTSASADKIPNFVLTGGFNFGFALGLSAKDVRLCLEEGERLGVPMVVGGAVRQFLNAAKEKFGEQADMTEMIRGIEEAVGVQVRGRAAQRNA